MAITKALMYARVSSTSGTGTGLNRRARIAATRLNYFGVKVLCTVAGTPRTYQFDKTTYQVTQRRRGAPTQLSIEFFGFTPSVGQEVILGAGSLTNRLFRGKITGVEQIRTRQTEGRVVSKCTCLDWSYTVDGTRSVSAKFTTTGGDLIAVALVAAYGPAGCTTNHVQGGLTVLSEIQFTMQSLNEALQQLCDRLGAYFYWDFDQDLHLFTTDTSGTAPESLTSSNKHVHRVNHRIDIEDLRNRIYVEGDGSIASAAILAGSTTLPIQDATVFSASGGKAKLQAQRITYTGKSDGDGTGSVAVGLNQGPSAPSGSVSSGVSGDVVGDVKYKVSHRMPGGDSEVSAASSTVSVAAISAPASAPTAAAASGSTGNLPATDTYKYKVTYVTSEGETLAGSASGSASIAAVSVPTQPTLTATTGGSLTALATYFYVVTYVTSAGETTAGTGASLTLTGANNAVNLTSIPTSADGRVTARRIYRTVANPVSLVYQLVTTIANNSATTYTDTTADAALGAIVPTTNTTGWGQVSLTSIPTSGDARVTARKLYRQNSSGTYRYLATIGDNSTTTYTDNTALSGLGEPEPIDDTSGGGVVTVTVPVGGATVTARRLWRTEDGGAVYKYLGSIPDNVTTTYTDSKADANLGDDAPDGSTVRVEAGSTFLPVASLDNFGGIFISDSGWVRVNGAMVLRYDSTVAGIGVFLLAGIPASGVGSITGPIAAGSAVINEPHLKGIPASGDGALQYDLTVGASVNLIVVADDSPSQSTYGVRDYSVQDRRLGIDGANTRAAAELALRKDPRVSGSMTSSDPKLRAGAPLSISNWGITATVTIDQVTITSPPDRPQPLAEVSFASRSIEDLYATLRDLKDRLNQ